MEATRIFAPILFFFLLFGVPFILGMVQASEEHRHKKEDHLFR